jgi:hypothetical protein
LPQSTGHKPNAEGREKTSRQPRNGIEDSTEDLVIIATPACPSIDEKSNGQTSNQDSRDCSERFLEPEGKYEGEKRCWQEQKRNCCAQEKVSRNGGDRVDVVR